MFSPEVIYRVEKKKLILLKFCLLEHFRKLVKDKEKVLDIVKFFAKSAKEKRQPSTFFIFEPTEIRASRVEISACVTTEVSDMCRRFEDFVESFNKGDLQFFTKISFPT